MNQYDSGRKILTYTDETAHDASHTGQSRVHYHARTPTHTQLCLSRPSLVRLSRRRRADDAIAPLIESNPTPRRRTVEPLGGPIWGFAAAGAGFCARTKTHRKHRQSLTLFLPSRAVASRVPSIALSVAYPDRCDDRPRRTSASARTTVRDARVVFVALRVDTQYMRAHTVSHASSRHRTRRARSPIIIHHPRDRDEDTLDDDSPSSRSIDRSFVPVAIALDDERTETRSKTKKNHGRT